MTDHVAEELIARYNKPVPRYTSYPTVPFWTDGPDVEKWKQTFTEKFGKVNVNGISLYIHLPFCESLCTYCGCNKKITTNHNVEDEYIEAVQKEWTAYRKLMGQTPVIRELHLGGGTPTFFSPANLKKLIRFILRGSIIHPRSDFSIEGHPNNTTPEHLRVLASLNFKRISYGVQDNDPDVQRIINRIQPLENVKAATENARTMGFKSVNYDLIYGLPLQTLRSMERTIRQIIALKPDRIAFYSYAHVPWASRGQRLFDESHLPAPEEKIKLYMKGRELLTESGYTDIGMDHFALPTDAMYATWKEGRLHRNFMGYTTQKTELLLGLGVSAISDTGDAFAQNEKNIRSYYMAVNANRIPVAKGCFLTEEDIAVKKYILDITCRGETELADKDMQLLERGSFIKLSHLQSDGLIEWTPKKVKLTALGRYFIRNVCAAFDQHAEHAGTGQNVFSQAI